MQNKNYKKQSKDKKSVRQVMKLALQLFVLLILVVVASGIFYFYNAYGKTLIKLQSEAKQKVSESSEDTFKAAQTSLVYDSEGEVISSVKAEKDVYYMEYEDIPLPIVDAMVVSEDRKFLEHGGVDYWANIRAAIALIKNRGEITQGASTITQQLARNVFLTQEVTYERKISEIFVAQELEKKYTKFDILEYYLNNIYFANGFYGIQAAANGYFGTSVTNLNLSQMIFLCAIPNNPNLYNPITNMDNTLARRDRILLQMAEDKKISQEEYSDALSETIELNHEKTAKKNYVETYVYYSAIRALMKDKGFEFRNQFKSEQEREVYEEAYYDLYYSCQKELYVSGYRIYTSIDMKKQKLLQTSVDDALKEFKEKNEEGVYQMQGAAVCIDNDSGRVVAIVGGRGQKLEGYTLNRGYQSYRQPGSAIKPLIVYTPAFERDYTPYSIVDDKRLEDGPKNSGGSYLGKIKLQKAIELSKNTVAWQVFKKLTPNVGLSYLFAMNFNKIVDKDYVLAASLGGFTNGASPVEMAAAYSTIENDGDYREPTCIVKIMDSEGNEIVGEKILTKEVYQEKAARIMTEALTGVIKKGTGKGLGLTNTISAGKTGTTNDKKDGWFVGYTPYYTTSVWVGYDLPKKVDDLSGATYPGTIWHNFMDKIHTSSMTDTFELFDWREILKKEQEEKDRLKKEQESEIEELESEISQEDEIGSEGDIVDEGIEAEEDITSEEDGALEKDGALEEDVIASEDEIPEENNPETGEVDPTDLDDADPSDDVNEEVVDPLDPTEDPVIEEETVGETP